ncbi:EpsG family protein [Sphingobacterium thalpophilum]|uniref:EpsG family protein n=1 Tax=Sphingobacterium thalpophilum TaxID=259 RepID=UPI003DA3A73B
MEFYLILVFILILLSGFSKHLRFIGSAIFFVLLAIIMFRAPEVGTDTKSYLQHFYIGYGSQNFSVKNFEFVYIWVVRLLSNTVSTPQFVLYFLAVTTLCFLRTAFSRLEIDLGIGLMFFVLSGIYFYAFNGSRQIASVSILLFAYTCLIRDEKNSKIYFLLATLLAASIHISSIFYIFLVFLPTRLMNFKLVLIAFIVSSVIFLFEMSFISKYVIGLVGDYYLTYSDVLEVSNSTSLSGKIFYLLIAINQFIIYIKVKDRLDPKLVNLYVLSIILFLLFRNMHPLISRILYGITIIQVVVMSKIFDKKYVKEYIFLASIMILQIYSLIDMLNLNVGEIIPYRFYFPF